jgi:iron(II)-dependent oxidoreductase
MGITIGNRRATAELAKWVSDARQRTIALVADLTDEQMMGPRLPIVNPLLWEIGHTAWFQEKWVLRHVCREQSYRQDADELYDSIAIPHDTRWDLPLPSRTATLEYLESTCLRVLEKLAQPEPSAELLYHVQYTVFHEDMHNEAFAYARQTLAYAAPQLKSAAESNGVGAPGEGQLPGDVEILGGSFLLGAAQNEPFVFDNEKWAHRVEVKPFAIARAPVTQGEFREFVEDGGYAREEFWNSEGLSWHEKVPAKHPVYWRKEGGEWLRRDFDRWVRLEPYKPMIHVSWHEAQAYCNWAGRRLPTEAEWEFAATAEAVRDASVQPASKRQYPWGEKPPDAAHANTDLRSAGCVDVGALPASDSAAGCRQMLGNVWEWTESDFLPYPGFVADPYKEYSAPWFGSRKVLRGGCWATRSRLLRNTYRNFYTQDRRDVWAGFRTCEGRRRNRQDGE